MNTLARWLLLLFFVAGASTLRAQMESERDSLESLLPFANDLQRADILNGLANCLRSTDTTRAGNYARQALTLSTKLNYCKGRATAEVTLGILQKNHQNFLNARKHYLTGLSLALKCKEPYAVSFAYHSLGNLAYLEGDYTKAMRYYIASVRLSEQLKDALRSARTYNNIGSLYMELRNPDKAEIYYQRSLEIYKTTNNELMQAEIANNLANIYQAKGFEMKALYHYNNALEVFRRRSSASDISTALHNIGLVYLSRKQTSKAIPYLYESYQMDMKMKDQQSLGLVMSSLVSAYLQLHKLDSATYYANQCLQLIQTNPNLKELPSIYDALSEYAQKRGDGNGYAQYQALRKQAETKLIGQEKKDAIGVAAAEFESQLKEQKLKLQAKENELNQLKISGQEQEMQRRSMLYLVLGVLLTLAAVIAVLIVMLLRQRRKLKLEGQMVEEQQSVLRNLDRQLRGPANMMLGMSQLATESKTFAELKEYLLHLQHGNDELLMVLNNLSNNLDGKPVSLPFDLLEMLEEIFRIIGVQCRNKGLLFHQMVFPGVESKVKGDKQRLATILQVLLVRAIKLTSKGVVKIEVRQSARQTKEKKECVTLQFTIIDEGAGYSEKEIRKLFQKVTKEGNAGLPDLFEVKQLADSMDGHLQVISEKGVGSSFILELELETPMETTPSRTNRLYAPGNYHVLVAEQDAISRIAFQRMLEKTGYSCSVVSDGLAALAKLRERKYSLLVVSDELSEFSGIEVIRHLRGHEDFASSSEMPVIAVLSGCSSGDAELAFKAGANRILTKPVQRKILLQKVEELLNK